MFIPEHVFRHVGLSTQTLDELLDVKNNLYMNDYDVPFTKGIYSADIHPDLSEKEEENLAFQRNWIVNTDTSDKPGTHWQCVLYKQSDAPSSNAEEPCLHVKYYIIDSWGAKHFQKIAKDVIDTIIDNYNMKQKRHQKNLQSKGINAVVNLK